MKSGENSPYRLLAEASQVGITVVAATLIGLFIGLKLDEWIGTSPWFTGVFFLLGVIAGFRTLFSYAKRSQENDDKGEEEKP